MDSNYKTQQIKKMAKWHYPLKNINESIKHINSNKLESKNLTLVFVDICGFTKFSMQNSSENTLGVIQILIDVSAEYAKKFNAEVLEFTGDEAFAAFESSTDAANYAREVQTSLEKGFREYGLKVGIGLNRDEVGLGWIGNNTRKDYRVVGKGINIAKKLEALSRGEILASKSVLSELSEIDFPRKRKHFKKFKNGIVLEYGELIKGNSKH